MLGFMEPSVDLMINGAPDGSMSGLGGEVVNLSNQLGGMVRFDPGLLRPYVDPANGWKKVVDLQVGWENRVDSKGEKVVHNEGEQKGMPMVFPKYKKVMVADLVANGTYIPIYNATSLRKDDWIRLDRAVVQTARSRLKAWGDLSARSNVSGFDAMSKTLLEHETMSDPGVAQVDMDGLSMGRTDTPLFQLEGTPLPITHGNFWTSARQQAMSRNSNMPFGTAMAVATTRRIAETVEKTLIGVQTGITYGTASDYGRTPTVYGYTNFPNRVTKTDMTAPDGTNGNTVHGEWVDARELMYAQNFFGPFVSYVSNDYDAYLDRIFSTSEPSAGTLRDMLSKIEGVAPPQRLDLLTNTFNVIFVEMTSETAQAINGMTPTVMQWDEMGGAKLMFKVMAIQVPQLKADYSGQCGIGHFTTA